MAPFVLSPQDKQDIRFFMNAHAYRGCYTPFYLSKAESTMFDYVMECDIVPSRHNVKIKIEKIETEDGKEVYASPECKKADKLVKAMCVKLQDDKSITPSWDEIIIVYQLRNVPGVGWTRVDRLQEANCASQLEAKLMALDKEPATEGTQEPIKRRVENRTDAQAEQRVEDHRRRLEAVFGDRVVVKDVTVMGNFETRITAEENRQNGKPDIPGEFTEVNNQVVSPKVEGIP